MPASHRFTDVCTGHGCFPPRPTASGSPNVFVNSLDQMRVTDPYEPHCCGTCHPGNLAAGSPNVYVNSLAAGRIGDPVDCGSLAAQGSPDVFING